MRLLSLIALIGLALTGCKAPESVGEAADNLSATKDTAVELAEKGKKLAAPFSEAAAKKAAEAEKFAKKIAADKELGDAAKTFIVATLSDANGLVSAAATAPIESAMRNAPASSQWLRAQVAKKVGNSKGDAKVAWQLLLNRIDEKIKASKK